MEQRGLFLLLQPRGRQMPLSTRLGEPNLTGIKRLGHVDTVTVHCADKLRRESFSSRQNRLEQPLAQPPPINAIASAAQTTRVSIRRMDR